MERKIPLDPSGGNRLFLWSAMFLEQMVLETSSGRTKGRQPKFSRWNDKKLKLRSMSRLDVWPPGLRLREIDKLRLDSIASHRDDFAVRKSPHVVIVELDEITWRELNGARGKTVSKMKCRSGDKEEEEHGDEERGR